VHCICISLVILIAAWASFPPPKLAKIDLSVSVLNNQKINKSIILGPCQHDTDEWTSFTVPGIPRRYSPMITHSSRPTIPDRRTKTWVKNTTHATRRFLHEQFMLFNAQPAIRYCPHPIYKYIITSRDTAWNRSNAMSHKSADAFSVAESSQLKTI